MRDSLIFFVNGKRHELRNTQVCWTLAEYLRSELRLTGTKVVCAEGDCGACSVLVGRLDRHAQRLEYRAIDACIAFMYQLDGCHIVSVEGLKKGETLSPVQQAMVDCYGSQCGFCTPGFVVTLHELIARAGCSAADDLDREQLRTGLSGNLCRCTGYEQIMEAAEAVGPGELLPIAQLFDEGPIFDELATYADDSIAITAAGEGDERQVLVPTTVVEAAKLKAKYPQARLICGATDLAVQRNLGRIDPQSVICLNRVEGFNEITTEDGKLVVGAGATWTDLEPIARQAAPEFWDILERFGSPQIRNCATIGGNLPMPRRLPIRFLSCMSSMPNWNWWGRRGAAA